MKGTHVFDPAADVAYHWLDELMTTLALPRGTEGRALHALRAGLHAIRDRLPASEVVDLGAQLPTMIRGLYYEGWSLRNDPKQIRDRTAMIARVKTELAPDPRLDPIEVLRGVIGLLVTHVSPGEIRDVLQTLPRSIAALWHELTGHALEALPPAPRRAKQIRHTGYSR